ncbi:MAG: cupin domain-containing protein [candidate division Zixibacteria bacterium]|nr:cupin domain-containing protein [candidate division Zixibacteria bacterium]
MKITDFKDVEVEQVKEAGSKGVTVRWLIAEKDGVTNFAMRLFEVEPSGFTPYHKHSWEHEVFILQGRGILVTEEKNFPLKKDDAVFVPPDEKHQFKNDSDEKFTFICVVPIEKQS